MAFTYGEEAKSRVSSFGSAEILEFLERVPEKYRGKVFGGLKPILGFRQDEPRELKERIKKLAKNLPQVVNGVRKSNERDWNTLGAVWAGWLQSTYKYAEDALNKYEVEKFDFEVFLKTILSHEGGNKLAREDVSKIFKFSPFSSLNEEGESFRSIPTLAELAKRNELSELKGRLAAVEKQVDSLSATLTQKKEVNITNDQVTRLQSEIVKLSEELHKLEKRSLLNEEQGISQNNLLRKALESLTHSNDGISKQLQAYESRVAVLDKSNAEFIGTVRKIEGIVKVLQKSTIEHEKDRALRRDSELAVGPDVPASTIQANHFHRPGGAVVADLDTLKKLHATLTNNYQAIGLSEKASKKLAFTVAASISSRQLTQFFGSLADVVADATLSAVAGRGLITWDVPAGLCDGHQVAQVLNKFVKNPHSITGLLLRGFNKSAFDVYGYELKKILVNRLLGLNAQATEIILVATALNSDACLPLSTSTVELGPVVDTSLLVWGRPKGEINYGQLSITEPSANAGEYSDSKLTDLANQIADMPLSKTELWRRSVRHAKTTLTYFVNDNKDVDVDVVESLLVNWVLPWISLQCTSSDDLRKLIRDNLHVIDEYTELANIVEKYQMATI